MFIIYKLHKIKIKFYRSLDWNKGYFITEGGYNNDKLLFVYGLRDIHIHSLTKSKPMKLSEIK